MFFIEFAYLSEIRLLDSNILLYYLVLLPQSKKIALSQFGTVFDTHDYNFIAPTWIDIH